jgi:hypothetical protein
MLTRSLAALTLVLSLPVAAAADTLRVPADFATIQAAVDAAVAGDVVLVAKGTYTEAVLVDGKQGITLKGAGKPAIDVQGAATPLTVQNSQQIVVDGLVLENALEHLVVIAGSSEVTILRCTLQNTPDEGDGINAENSANLVIEKNLFRDVGGDGVDFDDDTDEVTDSRIAKNRFERLGDGAVDLDGSGHLVEKNRVSRADVGVQVDEGGTDSTVSKNTIEDTDDSGIDADGANNVFEKNKLRRLGDEGIHINGDGNRVEKNKVDFADDEAIDVEGSDNQFLSNKGKNSGGNGVEVGEPESPGTTTGNLFEANKITGSAENGFLVRDTGNTFRANKASKSGGFDLLDETTPGGNTYEDNQFGTESLP